MISVKIMKTFCHGILEIHDNSMDIVKCAYATYIIILYAYCYTMKIPFHSRVMGFSNNCLLFLFSWERGFLIGNSGTGEPSTPHHEQMIFGEEMHTLITFMVSVMASNIVDSL